MLIIKCDAAQDVAEEDCGEKIRSFLRNLFYFAIQMLKLLQ